MEALADTIPAHDGRLYIRMHGERAMRNIVAVVEVCKSVDLGKADLLLDTRCDELVRRRADLDAACEALRESDMRLHIALVGVENFSRPELQRMNKGLTPLTNLDAAIAMLELERDHPDTFCFREHGGLSLILYSPWTTLEDLALNLRIIHITGLERICGKTLSGRMRLEPGLPITPAAIRDGLIADDRYDDAAFETAALNLYAEEIPWRFQDERMEPICQVLLRLGSGEEIDADDPLAAHASKLLEAGLDQGRTPLMIGLGLVEERLIEHALEQIAQDDETPEPEPPIEERPIEAAPPPADDVITEAPEPESPGSPSGPPPSARDSALEMIEKATEATGNAPPSRYPVEERVYTLPEGDSAGITGIDSDWDIELLVALGREGLKPVSKIELMTVGAAEDLIERCQLPNAQMRHPMPNRDLVETFFGTRAEDVQSALQLSATAAAPRSSKEFLEATLTIGALLGYPSCCVEAFAKRESALTRASYVWLHLARRMAEPGPVPPAMNPFHGLLAQHYVPCSLACEASAELMPKVHAVARAISSEGPVSACEESMANPWLSILRGQGSAVELIPTSDPGERFTFKAGRTTGAAPELDVVLFGDEIIMEPERLLIQRRGRLLLDLTAKGFVWWHERALQSDFWTRILTLRAFRGSSPTWRGTPAFVQGGEETPAFVQGGETPVFVQGEEETPVSLRSADADPDSIEEDAVQPDPNLARLRRVLRNALQTFTSSEWNVWVRSHHALILRLGRGEGAVLLYVTDKKKGEPALFYVGPFAFTIPKNKLFDTAEKRVLVKAFARHIQAWMVSRVQAR
jgi:hypothetical protein